MELHVLKHLQDFPSHSLPTFYLETLCGEDPDDQTELTIHFFSCLIRRFLLPHPVSMGPYHRRLDAAALARLPEELRLFTPPKVYQEVTPGILLAPCASMPFCVAPGVDDAFIVGNIAPGTG